jgi:hypothetical protein
MRRRPAKAVTSHLRKLVLALFTLAQFYRVFVGKNADGVHFPWGSSGRMSVNRIASISMEQWQVRGAQKLTGVLSFQLEVRLFCLNDISVTSRVENSAQGPSC